VEASLDGERWAFPGRTSLPIRSSQGVPGKLLSALDWLWSRTQHTPEGLAAPARRAAAQDFVVYSKAPLAGPEQVLRYLGRYTHRIAISSERLIAHRDGQVTFSYKDRKRGGHRDKLVLPGADFTRRFLRHVVPRRLVRVRHYGLLANGVKVARLTRARSLLGNPVPREPSRAKPESWQDTYRRIVGRDPLLCPACGVGRLVVVAQIPRLDLGQPASRSP
jgi:hypothetical protein